MLPRFVFLQAIVNFECKIQIKQSTNNLHGNEYIGKKNENNVSQYTTFSPSEGSLFNKLHYVLQKSLVYSIFNFTISKITQLQTVEKITGFKQTKM